MLTNTSWMPGQPIATQADKDAILAHLQAKREAARTKGNPSKFYRTLVAKCEATQVQS